MSSQQVVKSKKLVLTLNWEVQVYRRQVKLLNNYVTLLLHKALNLAWILIVRKRVLNNIKIRGSIIWFEHATSDYDKCPHMRNFGGDMDLIAYVTY